LKKIQSPQIWATKEIWLAPFVATEEFSVVIAIMTKKI
jgi:hypothetical protein